MRKGHMLTLRVLAVKKSDLELLPGQVRPALTRQQGLALPAATATLGFDFIAAFDLRGVGDNRHHHAVAIENRIGWRDAAELRAVPPTSHDFDLAIDGKNSV